MSHTSFRAAANTNRDPEFSRAAPAPQRTRPRSARTPSPRKRFWAQGDSRPTTASAIPRALRPPPRQGARAPASSSTSCTATTRSITNGATTFWWTWTSRTLAKPRHDSQSFALTLNLTTPTPATPRAGAWRRTRGPSRDARPQGPSFFRQGGYVGLDPLRELLHEAPRACHLARAPDLVVIRIGSGKRHVLAYRPRKQEVVLRHIGERPRRHLGRGARRTFLKLVRKAVGVVSTQHRTVAARIARYGFRRAP